MSLLQQLDIFELRPLITNLSCKLSTISEYDGRKQLLCLVSEENDILLRYTSDGTHTVSTATAPANNGCNGQQVLKLISWFRRTNRVIHDVCFDPTGHWLLVLCFDNTLHIVPALAVVDKPYSSEQPQPYSTTQVTSYIIPFVGPHECPNSKKCPNHSSIDAPLERKNCANVNHAEMEREFPHLRVSEGQELDGDDDSSRINIEGGVIVTPAKRVEPPATMEAFSHDMPEQMLPSTQPAQCEDKTGNSQMMAASFMASATCPFPLSVVWWQTIDGMNRAIIGYSDGSICFVGLSPNCPFVASTAIECGSVMKLLLCKDNTFESVMLLITSSLKQQFKLLLEQKAIKYVYPGDSSPSNTQTRDNDWQIVMPLRGHNSNSSEPASDSSLLDEDVFIKTEESLNKVSDSTPPKSIPATPTTEAVAQMACKSTTYIPPPPPYSVAINRNVENVSMTTNIEKIAAAATTNLASTALGGTTICDQSAASTCTTGLRPQQQPRSNAPVDDFHSCDAAEGGVGWGVGVNGSTAAASSAGILPAARARLASLRSLGSKKFNAIKMRLTDNRQKLEEYMPENTLGSSFAIMDSPSLTPELLASNAQGSFYTIQNLRNTYLLSALHSQSNSLSVHSIDINLKPLFLYKIPNNCYDILISSNLLYSIQYVDVRTEAVVGAKTMTQTPEQQSNTEKENRDTDIEKQEKYTEEIVDLSDDDDKLMQGINARATDVADSSAETSATTSVPSINSYVSPSNLVNAVGVISSAMASVRTGVEDKFNISSQLGLFRFEHETVLSLYQMATFRTSTETQDPISREEKAQAFAYKDIRSPMEYVQFYEHAPNIQEEFSLRQMEIMQNEFPRINYDPCYVVTNKNVYFIQLKKEPFAVFLEAALANEWMQCREFCNTFDLNYEACIEFAGDYLLRRKKVTQALLTYNAARIKPIRTALKLAMFGQTNALMHLCAMALKTTHTLKSKYFCHPILQTIMTDITYRHSEDVRPILPPTAASYLGVVNEGATCSDYVYGVDEVLSNLQMSPSSQFHLANLLLITLAEKAVNDKNYLPLWNFLCTNTKYHTNMTSIVLCQSGLFSAALILAKSRGVCIDTFLALTSVVGQEFGWYTELNVCLYNLSEPLFTETMTYVPNIAAEYFNFIQEKVDSIRPCVLKRLEQQLNPFSAILRPIVSNASTGRLADGSLQDNNTTQMFAYCKTLIDTYLAVLIQMESQRCKREHITNALSTFRITYEDNQFAIESARFKPISAGCVHCACIVDGVAYFWGSNGVPCNYSVNKTSDPPEPPHAVKSLELLSQLNLEVHSVKCGRQHSLMLTNNGLYAFGNNNFAQLGVGKQLQMSLQPMLVQKFDGKNITILEAGQYHNAVVADNLLYTWGWGVYGQLGHGNTDDLAVPKPVEFFRNKHILQVSLGHAHSLVLCCDQLHSNEACATELYAFGSNHFGQLGIGGVPATASADMAHMAENESDTLNYASQVKSLVPLKVYVSAARIRLIHTKFFTNLAVDDAEQMFTWGSSPQALRLANQIKRRANAKQKIEEHQRREMSKRFEATMGTATFGTSTEEMTTSITAESPLNADSGIDHATQSVPTAIEVLTTFKGATLETENETKENSVPISPTSTDAAALDSVVDDLFGDITSKPADCAKNTSAPKPPIIQVTEVLEDKRIDLTQQKQPPVEVDPCEHMAPHLVDTSEVAGQILQVSSGLFHFALISSTCTLYTWGKNLEHQLGTEDKDRRPVNKPSPVDSIERPMFVDCGADFTLVMTTDYVVKAFGGNSNGQCGRDLGPSIDKIKQRVVCLPTTKRLMRFESQCVDVPVEINLPRPRIRLDMEPVRYLKTIAPYQANLMQSAHLEIAVTPEDMERPSPQYQSTTQAESSDTALTGHDSDDLISSLENLSNNDVSSLNASLSTPLRANIDLTEQSSPADELLPANRVKTPTKTELNRRQSESSNNNNNHNGSLSSPPPSLTEAVVQSESTVAKEDSADLQQLRNYIHYCLYIFHGLYNPERVCTFSQQRLEYRVRMHMLNFKFVDAFMLCLQDCSTASKTLKFFEYFSKDATSCVPVQRQDVKFLIYYLLVHFLTRTFDMVEAEHYFLADLDYYLLELAYVLYFNNNNTVLEHNLNQKFKDLIAPVGSTTQQPKQDRENALPSKTQSKSNSQMDGEELEHKMQETDAIFDSLSVKFKTIVCQKLIKKLGK